MSRDEEVSARNHRENISLFRQHVQGALYIVYVLKRVYYRHNFCAIAC